jgi:probable HAF family extracellular repeat protein
MRAFVIHPVDTDGDGQLEWYRDAGNGTNGLMIDLGGLQSGDAAEANGINALGAVVGQSFDGQRPGRGFLWRDRNGNGHSDAGEMSALFDTGMGSYGRAINDHDTVVGSARTAEGWFAHVWRDRNLDGTLSAEETIVLARAEPGDPSPFTEARDINEDGQVVGRMSTAALDLAHPFVWQDRNGNQQNDPGELVDLRRITAGDWLIQTAEAINDAGVIVGTALPPFGDRTRPVLLIPRGPSAIDR